MNNFAYKYGAPTIIQNSQTRRGEGGATFITGAPVTIESVSFLISDTLTTGLSSVDLDLDNISGKVSRAESQFVDSLTANTTLFISVKSDVLVESNVLFGSDSDAIDSDFKVKVLGNFGVTGTKADIKVDNLLIKDNVFGIGIENTDVDNFVNGFYFPKNDQFSGFGLSIDKVGILNFPFGTFESSSQFNQISSSLKRFENNKTSIRFVYIDTNYNLETPKTTSTPFTTDEQLFINSLNNITNQVCNNYINIESDNITCHGGNFISGLSKDLNLIVTNASNQELTYLTCSLSGNSVNIFKNIELKLAEHSIFNNGIINFYSKSLGTIQLQLTDSGHFTNRSLNFNDDGTNNSHIIFGSSGTQTDFSINHSSTSSPYLTINASSTDNYSDNRVFLKTKLEVEGPRIANDPTIIYSNDMVNNKINSMKPLVNTYLQSKTIAATATTTFTFNRLLDTVRGYSDMIFTGFVILSDTTNDKHMHLRLEGTFTTSGSGTLHQTQSIISKKSINLTSSSTTSDFTIESTVVSNGSFNINIISTLGSTFKGLVKLEIIQV